MFLRMSPEERLQANDNALRAILELTGSGKPMSVDLSAILEGLLKAGVDFIFEFWILRC